MVILCSKFSGSYCLIVQSVKQRKTVLQNVLREQQREERLQQANKGNTL